MGKVVVRSGGFGLTFF